MKELCSEEVLQKVPRGLLKTMTFIWVVQPEIDYIANSDRSRLQRLKFGKFQRDNNKSWRVLCGDGKLWVTMALNFIEDG